MSIRLLFIFAITEFLLCLTPGPAVLLVISQAVKNGFQSSLKGAAGILAGNGIYFVLSALGLGALLMSSATLFQIIKWVGAAYLVFSGLRMLPAKEPLANADQDVATPKRSARLFSKGLLLSFRTQRRWCSSARSCRSLCRRTAACLNSLQCWVSFRLQSSLSYY